MNAAGHSHHRRLEEGRTPFSTWAAQERVTSSPNPPEGPSSPLSVSVPPLFWLLCTVVVRRRPAYSCQPGHLARRMRTPNRARAKRSNSVISMLSGNLVARRLSASLPVHGRIGRGLLHFDTRKAEAESSISRTREAEGRDCQDLEGGQRADGLLHEAHRVREVHSD